MLQTVLDYRYEVHIAIAYVVAVWALFRGGMPEKLLSFSYILFFDIGDYVRDVVWYTDPVLTQTDWWAAGMDIFAAIAFTLVAVNANRLYPLWVAGFQMISVSAHLARELLESMTPIAYAVLVIGPSHFITLLFAIGMFRHIRRKKKYGQYRDWRRRDGPSHGSRA